MAFFCNSGTEANEAAIKLVRLHGMPKRRYKIITFEGSFHGRTLGLTHGHGKPKYHEGLGPLMAGFVYAPFGDLDAVSRLIDNETAAIMIEPIQGEGGVRIPPEGSWPACGSWPTNMACCWSLTKCRPALAARAVGLPIKRPA